MSRRKASGVETDRTNPVENHNNIESKSKAKDTELEKVKESRVSSSNDHLLKLLLFLFLTFQIAVYFLLVRFSRTRKGNMYFSSTAVFLSEFTKLLASLGIVMLQQGSVTTFAQFMDSEIIGKPLDSARLMVPSLLYMIQNNLLYVAMTHLEAVTFQITNQLKILSAALFSIALLGKRITVKRWICLLMLMGGVALVQIESYAASIESGKDRSKPTDGKKNQSFFTGLLCVLLASATSGFAGVYLEKRVKRADTSFWGHNIHLYLSGSILGLVGMYMKDGKDISAHGFFFGYDFVVWLVVLIGASDGLLVSLILKYAGTITKGFATSFAIVLSSIVSVYWFGAFPSLKFATGAVAVVIAVTTYGL